jgi:hypothetical protein
LFLFYFLFPFLLAKTLFQLLVFSAKAQPHARTDLGDQEAIHK